MSLRNLNNGKYDRLRKVFILGDDTVLTERWCTLLQENGCLARVESNPIEAGEKILEWIPDILVLDLVGPHEMILGVVRNVRSSFNFPILVFLHDYREQEAIELFSAGASDCFLHPVLPAAFIARVRLWLNSPAQFFSMELQDVEVNGVRLQVNENQVLLPDGTVVQLTNLEFRLLHMLMSRPGVVHEPQRIVRLVWGLMSKEDTSIVKHVIYRLRKKLEPDSANPQFICSIPGRGYYFPRKEHEEPALLS